MNGTSLIWTDAGASRRLLVGLALAGATAGVLGPRLTAAIPGDVGAVLAAGLMGLALCAGGWIARDGRLPRARALAGLVGGLFAGALAFVLPSGAAYVVFGLALGLALAPGRLRRGLACELAYCLPTAAGLLAAAIMCGIVAGSATVQLWAAPTQFALLGALLGLGVGTGELTRGLLVARTEPPTWVTTLLGECGAEVRPVLEAAIDAHRRVVSGVVRASWIDAWERRESLTLARELVEAAASAGREADAALRAGVSLRQDGGDLEGHAELKKARTHIREALSEQAGRALSEAARHAASLAKMAVAVTERCNHLPTAGVQDLASRAELLEERVLTGGSWLVS